MMFTLPSTILRMLALALAIYQADPTCDPKAYKKLFDHSRKLIEKLSSIKPVLAIKLSLELVLTINTIDEGKYYD